MYVILLFG